MAVYQDLGLRFVVLGFGELNRLNNTLATTERSIKSMSGSLSNWGSGISNIGRQLSMSVTLPVLALGAGIAKAGIDFEDSFAGISKTVEGVSNDFGVLTAEGELLAKEFRNLALEIPVSVNELNKIGEIGGQLGVGRKELAAFTDTVAKLAVATDLTSESAATSFARMANIMGVKAEDIAEWTLQAGNVVVELGNNAATTESEIMSLSLRIAGAGRVVGLTTPEILALSAELSALGIRAEMGGSAISRIFLEMKRATDEFAASGGEATNQLKLFAEISGVTVAEFISLVKNSPAEAFVLLTKGLSEWNKEGKVSQDMLKELNFDTVRLEQVLNAVGPNYEQLTQYIGMANDEWADGNALQIEAQKKFATTKSQLQLLRNSVADLGISIFMLYNNDIKNLIQKLRDWIQKFNELNDSTKKNIISILGLTAAIGPALMIFGRLLSMAGPLVSILTKLVPLFLKFGGGIAAIPLPILVGVGAGFLAIKTNLFGIGDLFQTVADWIEVITADFIRFTGVVEIVKNAFSAFLSGDFQTGLDLLKVAWDHVIIWFNTNGKDLFKRAFEDIKREALVVLTNASNEIQDVAKKWIPILVNWVQDASTKIVPALEKFLDDIVAWAEDAVTYLTPKLVLWGNAFVDWLIPTIINVVTKLGEFLETVLNWLGNNLPTIISKLLEWATAFISWLGPVIRDILPKLGELLGTILAWISFVALPFLIAKLWDVSKAFVAWVGRAVIEIGPELGKFLKAIVDFILYSLIPGIGNALKAFGKAFVNGMVNAIADNMPDLEGWLEKEFAKYGFNLKVDLFPGLARGGPVQGPAVVGENGPEVFIPGSRGYMINNQLTRLMADLGGMRGGGTTYNQQQQIYSPNIYGVPMNNEQDMSSELLRSYRLATMA